MQVSCMLDLMGGRRTTFHLVQSQSEVVAIVTIAVLQRSVFLCLASAEVGRNLYHIQRQVILWEGLRVRQAGYDACLGHLAVFTGRLLTLYGRWLVA